MLPETSPLSWGIVPPPSTALPSLIPLQVLRQATTSRIPSVAPFLAATPSGDAAASEFDPSHKCRGTCLVDSFAPLTFVGNHDVTRLASRLEDERHIAHAVAILMIVGGTPAIYAGDEQGFRGIKENRAGGDDDVRPAFPATPAGLAPFGWPLFRLHQHLIDLRRRQAWLTRAKSRIIHFANRHMVLSMEKGSECLFFALNLDDREANLPAPSAQVVLAGAAEIRGSKVRTARLAGHGWAVLSARRPGEDGTEQ
jgi:hypothetical protein